MNEIEIRGKISKEAYRKLESFLNKEAKLTDNYKRLSVDISPNFDIESKSWRNPSEIDLRLKKSGAKEKIVVKVGYYASKNREEFEIDIKEGEFLDSLKLFEALGHKTGMIYLWESSIYEYDGFEIKINKYEDGYLEWEIEAEDPGKDPNTLADKLSLTPFTEEEFQKEIDWKNNNLHYLYSYKKVEEILKDWG